MQMHGSPCKHMETKTLVDISLSRLSVLQLPSVWTGFQEFLYLRYKFVFINPLSYDFFRNYTR